MTVSVNYPNALQTEDEQRQVTQKALTDLQKANNEVSNAPAILVHLPSTTDSVLRPTTSGTPVNITSYSWKINSRGGLVCIEASLNGSISRSDALSPISLVIDGKTVLTGNATSNVAADVGAAAWSNAFIWKAILGAGPHTISFQYSTNAGTLRLNGVTGTDRGFCSSAVSIVEFPSNVANLNVKGV